MSLSVTMAYGRSYLHMRCFQVNFSTSLAVISHSGLASIFLVKYLMAISRYLTAPRAFYSGSSMSIPHMAEGQGELKLWRLSKGVHEMSANSWHRLHLFVKSRVLALSASYY